MARTTNLPQGDFDRTDDIIGNDGQRTSRFGADEVIDVTEAQITNRVVESGVPVQYNDKFVSSFLSNTITFTQEYGSSTPATVSGEVIYLNASGGIVMTSTIASAIDAALDGTSNQKVIIVNQTTGYLAEYFIDNASYRVENNILHLGHSLDSRLGPSSADVAALGQNSDFSNTIVVATSSGITINGVDIAAAITTGTMNTLSFGTDSGQVATWAEGDSPEDIPLTKIPTIPYTQLSDTPTTITTEESTKLGHISVTQAVDLDDIESDVTLNNAKVTNRDITHGGSIVTSIAGGTFSGGEVTIPEDTSFVTFGVTDSDFTEVNLRAAFSDAVQQQGTGPITITKNQTYSVGGYDVDNSKFYVSEGQNLRFTWFDNDLASPTFSTTLWFEGQARAVTNSTTEVTFRITLTDLSDTLKTRTTSISFSADHWFIAPRSINNTLQRPRAAVESTLHETRLPLVMRLLNRNGGDTIYLWAGTEAEYEVVRDVSDISLPTYDTNDPNFDPLYADIIFLRE